MATSSNTAVLATGAALLAVGVGCLFTLSNTASSNQEIVLRDIDDDDIEDFVTEQDIVEIFDALFLEAQNKTAQIMQQLQQLQRMGQSLPEAQVQAVLQQTIAEALTSTQNTLLQQRDIDEDCFEEAVWEFMEDENRAVKAAVERLQRLWQSTTGETVVGWKPGKTVQAPKVLSPEETIVAAETYYTALTKGIKDVVAEFRSSGKDMQSPSVQQELNLAISNTGAQVAEEALLKTNITQSQFEASVKAHQEQPQVARALAMLSMKQQQELQSIGSM